MTRRWPSGWKKPNSSRSGEWSVYFSAGSDEVKAMAELELNNFASKIIRSSLAARQDLLRNRQRRQRCEKRPAFDFRCATDVQILRCTTLNKFTRQFVLTFIWKVGRVAQDHLTPVWQPFEQSSRDLRRSHRIHLD